MIPYPLKWDSLDCAERIRNAALMFAFANPAPLACFKPHQSHRLVGWARQTKQGAQTVRF